MVKVYCACPPDAKVATVVSNANRAFHGPCLDNLSLCTNLSYCPNDFGGPVVTKREALVRRVTELEGRMHEAAGFGDPQGWLGTNVTMAQARALVLLRHAGSLRLSDLAAQMRVGPATASERVERLVSARLARRREDPVDRRHVIVTATPRGRTVADQLHDGGMIRTQRLLAVMTGAELAAVARGLEAMMAAARRLAARNEAPARKEASKR